MHMYIVSTLQSGIQMHKIKKWKKAHHYRDWDKRTGENIHELDF